MEPEPTAAPTPRTAPTRKSYTVAFKLSVVQELTASFPAPSIRALAQRHGVTPSMVRKWQASRPELEAAVARSSASHASPALRKLGSGRKPEHHALDQALLLWLQREQARGAVVKDKDMQAKARELATEQGISGFRASKGYIANFKHRNNLSADNGLKRQRLRIGSLQAEQTNSQAQVQTAQTSSQTQVQTTTVGEYRLGLDVGSTAVRCAIVCAKTGNVAAVSSAAVAEWQPSSEGAQSVADVLRALREAVLALPESLRVQIQSISICGKMHGILWWRCDAVRQAADELWTRGPTSSTVPDIANSPWSQYISGLDRRCSPAQLAQWRDKIRAAHAGDSATCSSSPIASGHGLASFAYMLECQPRDLVGFDACGTMQDLVAFVLCGHSLSAQACIDTTDAFSWGGYDLTSKMWNPHTVQALGVPAYMLPTVKTPGDVIGQSSNVEALLGLPNGRPVHVAMGVHPCSVLATLSQAHSSTGMSSSLLNMDITAQLAIVLTGEDVALLKGTSGDDGIDSQNFQVRPFLLEDRFLGLASSNSGGGIFAWFVKQCQAWSQQLAMDPTLNQLSEKEMHARLISLGRAKVDTDLRFSPTLTSEHVALTMSGSLQQLRTSNWSLGDISAELCRGIVDNIFATVPGELRAVLSRQGMVGSGEALVDNTLLQHFIGKKFSNAAQLTIRDAGSAAAGAALLLSLLQK